MQLEKNFRLQDAPEELGDLLTTLAEQVWGGIETPFGHRKLQVMDVQSIIDTWIEKHQAGIDARNKAKSIDLFNEHYGENAYGTMPPSVRADMMNRLMWDLEAQEGDK